MSTKLHPNGYWSYDRVKSEALKYSTLKAFREQCRIPYEIACKNKWLNDYTWLTRKSHSTQKYTYEECYEAAKSCHTKTEFAEKHRLMWNTARYHKWLNDYTWFKNGHVKWTPKLTKNEARKYRSLNEFMRGSESAYKAAVRNKWIENYNFLERKRNMAKKTENKQETTKQRQPKYSFEQCLNESKKYPNRSQFKKNARNLYNASKRYDWLSQFTWLTPKNKQVESCEQVKQTKMKGRKQIWTFESTATESKQYKTKFDFLNGSKSAYQAAYRNGWLKQFTWLERKKSEKPVNTINWKTLRVEAVKTILPLVMQVNPNGNPTMLSETAIKHVDEMIERVQNANMR
jgi:hypothetical protein